MSMLFPTEELTQAMYPTYEGKDKVIKSDNTRLEKIVRTRINFFYKYEKMPLGEEIGILEPFQNKQDIYNEFRGIFIKPLLCDYLVAKHALDLSLELSMLVINVLTLSPEKSIDSLVNILEQSLLVVGYLINSAITDATVVPIFVLRLLATIGNSLIELITPKDTYQHIYDDYAYAQSHLGDVEMSEVNHITAASAPLAAAVLVRESRLSPVIEESKVDGESLEEEVTSGLSMSMTGSK